MILATLVQFVGWIPAAVQVSYETVLVVGYLLCTTICQAFSFLISLCVLLRDGLLVLNEDFNLFASDLYAFSEEVSNYVQGSVRTAFRSLGRGTTFVSQNLHDIVFNPSNLYGPWNILTLLMGFCKYCTHQVFEAFSLLGSTVTWTVKVSVQFLFGMPRVLGNVISILTTKAIAVGRTVKLLLTHEAFCGLMTLLVIGFLMLKFKYHLHFSAFCKQILSQSIILVSKCIDKVTNTLIAVFKRQKTISSDIDMNEFNLDDNYALKRLLAQEKASKLCIICMDGRRNVILMYCKHFVLCNKCAEVLVSETGQCPLCRNIIVEIIQVFT